MRELGLSGFLGAWNQAFNRRKGSTSQKRRALRKGSLNSELSSVSPKAVSFYQPPGGASVWRRTCLGTCLPASWQVSLYSASLPEMHLSGGISVSLSIDRCICPRDVSALRRDMWRRICLETYLSGDA
eukprot:705060-Pelagomonas_calceolata.AAC.2